MGLVISYNHSFLSDDDYGIVQVNLEVLAPLVVRYFIATRLTLNIRPESKVPTTQTLRSGLLQVPIKGQNNIVCAA